MSPGEYIDNVLMTGDRFLAALLGWSGKYTVSAECAAARCWFCCAIRAILGINHCAKAAQDEGLIETP